MPGLYKGKRHIERHSIQPWSDVLMRFDLPNPIIQAMRNIVENTLTNPNRESYAQRLWGLGHENEELEFSNSTGLDVNELPIEIYECFDIYIHECEKQLHTGLSEMKSSMHTLEFSHAWINVQNENEYIPIHMHNATDLSSVMYLGIPEGINEQSGSDGCIEFTGGINTWGRRLTRSTYRVQPSLGNMFVFPAYMGHTVYPFRGPGNRISVSINCIYTKE